MKNFKAKKFIFIICAIFLGIPHITCKKEESGSACFKLTCPSCPCNATVAADIYLDGGLISTITTKVENCFPHEGEVCTGLISLGLHTFKIINISNQTIIEEGSINILSDRQVYKLIKI
jgi:hypothetical protein